MADPLSVRDAPVASGAFRVTDREYDAATGEARLRYRVEGGPTFEEVLTFEGAPARVARPARLDAALALLHVAAGTSYYKATAPRQVVLGGEAGAGALAVHRALYDDGLREFAVANGLPVPRDVELAVAPDPDLRSRSGGPGAGPAGTTGSDGGPRTRWSWPRRCARSVPSCSPSTPARSWWPWPRRRAWISSWCAGAWTRPSRG
jgi:hypothetical protein